MNDLEEKKKLKILIFAPFSAIWVHAFPEALIAEALKQQGHEIFYITCGREFQEYCVAMRAYGLNQESDRGKKEKICRICNARKEIIKSHFKFKGYDLGVKLTPTDIEEIEGILRKVDQTNFLNIAIEGINLGRIALYQLLLQHKKKTLRLSESEWTRYLIELRNTLYSFFAGRRTINDEKPDRIITYNSLYSVNNAWVKVAEKNGIPTYFLHAGGNLSHRLETLYFGKGYTTDFFSQLISVWKDYRDIPCGRLSLQRVTDHFLELLKGRNPFAYSSPKSDTFENIREIFGIKGHQKVLVATMSSYDEIVAAEAVGIDMKRHELIFPSQIEWVNALVDFMEDRRDLFLIIRVHPREFPNKRESAESDDARVYRERFSQLPENVRVNWPSDGLSLYDLAEETDVILNSWSSAGKEMSLLGIPVVLYSGQWLPYPAELNYLADNKEDYFFKIQSALSDGWQFEQIRKAYRWYVLEYERAAIYISESFKAVEGGPSNLWKKAIRRLKNLLFPYAQSRADCRNRAFQLEESYVIRQIIEKSANNLFELALDKNPDRVSVDEETVFLKKEISRIIEILGKDRTGRAGLLRANLERFYKASI